MSLSPIQIILLCFYALMLATGQMLFKLTASSLPPLASTAGIMALLTNIWFWVTLALYGCTTLLWIYILQQVPLSLAYPFIALGFVFVPLVSMFLFRENINLTYALGVAFIITGIGIIITVGSK